MALVLHRLRRSFGSHEALADVSLRVERGDCYGLIGHNGAGKTTALRIALGLDPHFGGRVVVDGHDAARDPMEVRTRTGGLIEVPGFYGGMSGARNLELLGRLQGLGGREARREARRLLELMNLEEAGERPVRGWSQGMRQRLGIAQALLGSPAYVLLDEPTNGLDPAAMVELRALVRRLTHDEGHTVVLSSHQLHDVSALCNRVAVLHRGHLLVEAETARLLAGDGLRYQLATGDGERAVTALTGLGVSIVRSEPGELGELLVELGAHAPAAVVRGLVEAGCDVDSFAPRPPDLEEIYLRSTSTPEPPQARAAEPPAEKPTAACAPRRPVRRAALHELRRFLARPRTLVLLAAPSALAVVAVLRRSAEARADARTVSAGELYSSTDVTAFEATGLALQAAIPLLALVVAGLASQSLAAELARGTLRNFLLRPLRRWHAALGKALSALATTAGAYALTAGAALIASAWLFDFGDVTEILPNGARFPLTTAAEISPVLRRALVTPLPPLLAFCGIGFLASALARTSAGALALALGLTVTLDLARAPARAFDVEGWLPSTYISSPLGDSSFMRYYLDVAMGVSNASNEHGGLAGLVPLLWCLVAVALATLALRRRAVP